MQHRSISMYRVQVLFDASIVVSVYVHRGIHAHIQVGRQSWSRLVIRESASMEQSVAVFMLGLGYTEFERVHCTLRQCKQS